MNTPSPSSDESSSYGIHRDLIRKVLHRFWWLILLFALIGGAAMWYYATGQPRSYRKTSSVIMRDTEQRHDAASDRLLRELGADTGATNLANESYILKSTALMQSVVDKLNLNTTYSRRNQLRPIELYGESPVLVVFDKMNGDPVIEFDLTPLPNDRFRLRYTKSDGSSEQYHAAYGDTLTLPQGEISIHPTVNMDEKCHGDTLRIRREPSIHCARRLLEALRISRPDLKDASMLELSITAAHPRKAEDILNMLIAVYNQHTADEKNEAARKTRDFIVNRLRELGHDLGKVEKELHRTKENALPTDDEGETTRTANGSLGALDEDIFRKETELKLSDNMARELELNAGRGNLLSISHEMTGGMADKITLYNEACLEYNKYATSAGARNPIAIALHDRMNRALEAARQALLNHRTTLEIELRELRRKQQDYHRQIAEREDRELELLPLLREQKVKEELYMILLTKEQENALALAVAAPTARVLESAHGSDLPIAPRQTALVAAGASGGAALCTLGLVGLCMLNTKIQSKNDIPLQNHLPVLAELPRRTRRERKANPTFEQDNRSPMAEHLHILRNNTHKLLPPNENGGALTILITSTTPGEGKSFVSANLALSYARAGQKVLLIDGDLRKQTLTRELGGRGRRGLSSLLLRAVPSPAGVIHRLPLPARLAGQADILYAGPEVPEPVALLDSKETGQLFRYLRQHYDAIIVDSPPHGILADTDLLAAHVDITLYIIRAGKIHKHRLPSISQLAASGRLRRMGCVINGVNFRTEPYHSYGYGYHRLRS